MNPLPVPAAVAGTVRLPEVLPPAPPAAGKPAAGFASRRLTSKRSKTARCRASISVADATLNEIGSPSAFVAAGSGGLDARTGITLGPDGNVYVAGNGDEQRAPLQRHDRPVHQHVRRPGLRRAASDVLTGWLSVRTATCTSPARQRTRSCEYNGSTGAFLNAFVAAGSGGLEHAPRAIAFGPDGNLYVSSNDSNAVLRYQGPLAASPGTPLPRRPDRGDLRARRVQRAAGRAGLQLVFGPDGNSLRRSAATLGASCDTTAPRRLPRHVRPRDVGDGDLGDPRGMAFDQDGRLYVRDSGNAVHRYDTQGNFLGDLVSRSVPPAVSPIGMAFDAQGNLLISCCDIRTPSCATTAAWW